MYNPNPFEFVPFSRRTKIVDPVKFDESKVLYSGWLEVSLTALTPIHIAGKQEPAANKAGNKISSSSFYQQDGIPTIPGSSIKGMLRAFLEALTCGWVSQVNDIYPKVRGTQQTKGRHVGYGTFSNYPNVHSSSLPPHSWTANPFIAAMFKPDPGLMQVDIPSYMFGIVTDKENPNTKSKAMRAKVLFEDCPISSELKECEIPDIEGEAFMGGAHPSASSWWYMLPDEIWRRNTGGHTVAEFVGLRYRGRKFYFHQDPEQCIAWYDKNWVTLSQRPNKPLIPYYKYKMKCMYPDSSATFRIYVDRLPSSFFALLCLLLSPGENIKHKLGYGKAYGYGSLKFKINKAMLRTEKVADWPEELTDRMSLVSEIISGGFSIDNLEKNRLSAVIDRPSLDALARILGYHLHDQVQKKLIFSYPPFDRNNFARPIDFTEVQDILQDKGIPTEPGYPFKYRMNQARNGAVINHGNNIATTLLNSEIKRTIHLGAYQENAIGYKDIMERKP